MFDQHNELDQKIKNMEASISPGTHDEIETLKGKAADQDQLYTILKKRPEHRPGRTCWSSGRLAPRHLAGIEQVLYARKISKRENGFFMKSSAPMRLA